MSTYIDFSIQATGVETSPLSGKKIEVKLTDVDSEEILEHIDIEEFISYHGSDTIMENLSIDDVKEFFNLKDNEE